MAAALVGGFVGALFFGWWNGAIVATIMGWIEYRKGVAYGIRQGREKKNRFLSNQDRGGAPQKSTALPRPG